MENIKIKIDWDDFSDKIDKLILESKLIEETGNAIKSEVEFEGYKEKVKEWSVKGHDLFTKSFDPENNDFASGFSHASRPRYNASNQTKHWTQNRKELIEDLKEKGNTLTYNKQILSISDSIIHPEIIALGSRNDMTTEEILFLLLTKLYELYDNNYHSIRLILEGNGVTLKRYGEDRELATVLEQHGYVNVIHVRDATAQLTVQGKIYVEEKRKITKESYEDINESQDELNQKVDDIKERLIKLGYGQEIIFDEIEELKTLYRTLNKKNWGQILKGKLIDLALAKLIDNDSLEYVYKTLTNHKLHLP